MQKNKHSRLINRATKKKILITLSIIIAIIVLIYAGLVEYVYHIAKQNTPIKSDAIVVLGEAAMGGTSCFGPRCQNRVASAPHYNVCLVSRISHAVSLYNEHYASKLLMSGGTDTGDNVNEAETMKTIAIKDGVPAANILIETKSTSTYQNLAFSQKILTREGLHSAIIVTDPSTSARAGLVASKLHYTYSLSPDLNSPCSHTFNFIIREPLAIVYYFLTGKI